MSEDQLAKEDSDVDEAVAEITESNDGEESVSDDWAAALEEQSNVVDNEPEEKDLSPAQFQNLDRNEQDDLATTEDVNLDVILDVPVTISMEIGRTKLNIRNLLQLNQGSVVELDRLAGEPMDVLVNGTLIAHGEVVVVNDKFGIRLTDVISPGERVKKLK